MPAKVTLTLSKSGNKGYKVGAEPWAVRVHKNANHGPQDIEWELDPTNAVAFDKFVIDFKGKTHFNSPKVSSQPAGGGKYVAKTQNVKNSVPKRAYVYDIEFHFKDGSDNIKIVLDPDYIVED